VHTASAIEGKGIPEIWNLIMKYQEITQKSGYFEKQRRQQSKEWLHSMLREKIHGLFYNNEEIQKMLPEIENEVLEGQIPVTQAAWELLQKFEKQLKNIEK
jgi:LAO/AO transport system kinase